MPKYSGHFISFEGIDGSGKTTQIKLLVDYLKKNFPEKNVITSREPGGTDLGTQLREIILHSDDVYKNTELLLYMADRSEHVAKKIVPALKEGSIVICDRFIDSSVAYQYGGRGFSKELVDFLNNFSTDGLKPDITFLLDLDAKNSYQRISKNNTELDRLEKTGLDFFIKTRNAYLEIAKNQINDGAGKRVITIDALLPIEEIHNKIVEEINERLG